MHPRPARTLALLALTSVVALGSLAACGRAAGPATPGPTGTGGAILSGSPPATTAGPAPTTSGGTIAPPPPPTPSSTLASKAGYVWAYDSNSSYAASSAYQYNSSGGAITITHTATGRYVVTFNGLGGPGGVAHAQAYGNTPNFCSIASWTPSGANQNVAVNCYNVLGAYADTQFVANFTAGSQGSAHFSYLWANQQANPALYHPSSSYRYDSINAGNLTVQRTGTGLYEVFLPAAGPDLPDPWGFQVTAYGGANHCKLQSFNPATKKAKVACFGWGGGYLDLKFSLSFYSEGSLIGRTDRRYGESGTGYAGVSNPGIGQYTATFNEMGEAKGQVVAGALGVNDETYCHVRSWTVSGADLKANVNCYYPAPDNPAGQLMTSVNGFHASATW